MSQAKASTPGQFGELGDAGRKLLDQSRPARQEMMKQITEALVTGGVGARVPVIQRAMEQQNTAASGQSRGIEAGVAQRGASASPAGVGARSASRTQASTAAARTPAADTLSLITGAPKQIAAVQGQGFEGLGTAGGADLKAELANADSATRMWEDIVDSVARTIKAIAGAGGMGKTAQSVSQSTGYSSGGG